ncbi:MAG: phasin family protein [Caldilineaceae bacterium]|nr:phasin family protein [Caldilineaceae bacterium]
MQPNEKKSFQDQARDAVIDMRNELIVQSANLYLVVRKVLLASLGAMALTAEEANDLLARLVERGEIAEADMQKIVEDLRAQGRKREQTVEQTREELARKASEALEGRVETILTRLNVPNKAEIEEISRKISLLNEKVSALNHRREDTL